VVSKRVPAAQKLQRDRQGRLCADLAGGLRARHFPLDGTAEAFLQTAARRLAWQARIHHRVLRNARTIADLGHDEHIGSDHLAQAWPNRRVLKSK
jgi:magnesium chelatase family protein